jgi:hypothetical protein
MSLRRANEVSLEAACTIVLRALDHARSWDSPPMTSAVPDVGLCTDPGAADPT